MKKVFFSILAASMMLAGTVAMAQPSIGVGFANSTDKVKSGSTTNSTNLNGFYVGGSYNINLVGALNVAPGVYYSLLTRATQTVISVWLTQRLTLQSIIFQFR